MTKTIWGGIGLALAMCACAHVAMADDAGTTNNGIASAIQGWLGNTDPNREDWSVHAQATDVLQMHPAFPAAYSGANSLSDQSSWSNSVVGSIYLGRRLWDGAAVYYDRELYEGKGLSNTLGIEGFPNGEASKSGSWSIKTNDARLFIRQVIGLGGPTEHLASDQNQLADTMDVSRVTLTAGKFAATDIFDNNTYTHDATTQFLNWSLTDSAAWDFPANARGYTDGVAVEWNEAGWALRYGAFMEPDTANESNLVFHGMDNVGQVAELEERYTLAGEPGKTHFLVFWNRNREAYFSDVLGAPDVNAALLAARDYGDNKYGFAINAEQQLTDSVGVFTRISWNDGHTEDWMFADIDESAAMGVSVNGTLWGRPEDTWGTAGVINGTSADERKFLEEGGYAILGGDGTLKYAPEMILETYYAYKVMPYVTLSPDYQFVANPAFNQERGPVNVFTLRMHVAF